MEQVTELPASSGQRVVRGASTALQPLHVAKVFGGMYSHQLLYGYEVGRSVLWCCFVTLLPQKSVSAQDASLGCRLLVGFCLVLPLEDGESTWNKCNMAMCVILLMPLLLLARKSAGDSPSC